MRKLFSSWRALAFGLAASAADARHDGALTVDLFPSGLDQAAVAGGHISILDGAPGGPEFNGLDPSRAPAAISGPLTI